MENNNNLSLRILMLFDNVNFNYLFFIIVDMVLFSLNGKESRGGEINLI